MMTRQKNPGSEIRPKVDQATIIENVRMASAHSRSGRPRSPTCNPKASPVGDVPQSTVSAVDARELQGYQPRAGNALSKHREGETLRLRRLRLQARRRGTGLARA